MKLTATVKLESRGHVEEIEVILSEPELWEAIKTKACMECHGQVTEIEITSIDMDGIAVDLNGDGVITL